MATDWTDPCARAAALRSAYYQLLAGETAVRVVIKGGDTLQETEFQRADASQLLAALRVAESECAAAQGGKPRRYAIRGGAARGPGFGSWGGC
jgi:hypothetical protein